MDGGGEGWEAEGDGHWRRSVGMTECVIVWLLVFVASWIIYYVYIYIEFFSYDHTARFKVWCAL